MSLKGPLICYPPLPASSFVLVIEGLLHVSKWP